MLFNVVNYACLLYDNFSENDFNIESHSHTHTIAILSHFNILPRTYWNDKEERIAKKSKERYIELKKGFNSLTCPLSWMIFQAQIELQQIKITISWPDLPIVMDKI